MPSYKLDVVLTYDAKHEDSGDRENAIIAALESIPGVRVTVEYEAEEVMRFAGDDRPEA